MVCNVTLYGIQNCSTVKKARGWLNSRGISYQFHDLRKDGLSREVLMSWVHALGWEKLLNRSGMTFRKLPEENKQDLNEVKAVALMLSHPASIRRPILSGPSLTVGFKEDDYEAMFLSPSEDN